VGICGVLKISEVLMLHSFTLRGARWP